MTIKKMPETEAPDLASKFVKVANRRVGDPNLSFFGWKPEPPLAMGLKGAHEDFLVRHA